MNRHRVVHEDVVSVERTSAGFVPHFDVITMVECRTWLGAWLLMHWIVWTRMTVLGRVTLQVRREVPRFGPYRDPS